jgi:hypothetical protein
MRVSGIVLLAATVACALPVSAAAAVSQSWNPAIAVSPASESAEAPQAAIDAHGDLAVVWENRTSSYHTTIELSRKPVGGSFSAPVTIGEAPGENGSPAVALGPEGQVIVVWTSDADTQYEVREVVMASTGSIAAGQFSTPEAISGYEGGEGFMRPQAVITDSGEALVFWRGLDERFRYTERLPGGTHFAQPQTLGHTGSLALSPDGTALAVWGEGEELAAHLVADIKRPGLPFEPAETIDALACGELHAAINDAGDAVVDWTTTKECDSGGDVVLHADYRPAGGHFGASVDAAELGGWARAGGVAVSPAGRVAISTQGWMTSPASPAYVTALTRLPDGSYGAPETISHQELLEDPPVLAFDAEGNLYAAADTRDYWGELESGILANVAPAGGTFAPESEWLQTLLYEYEYPPALVTAGEGQVAAVWLADEERVELATLASAEATPPQDPQPAVPVPATNPSSEAGSVSGGAAASAEDTPSQGPASTGAPSAANPSGAVAGSISGHAAARHQQLTVTGRVGGARSIGVLLIDGRRVVRSGKARLSKGSFRALLSLDGLRPGSYRIEILRRGERWHHAAYRPFELTAAAASVR